MDNNGQHWNDEEQIHSNHNAFSWFIAILSMGLSFTYTLNYQQKMDGNGQPRRNEGQIHSNNNISLSKFIAILSTD